MKRRTAAPGISTSALPLRLYAVLPLYVASPCSLQHVGSSLVRRPTAGL
jgi:hypothetical protein